MRLARRKIVGVMTSANKVAGEKAVLLIGFNRPHTTEKVIEALKAYAPRRLYVACDGPKAGSDEDAPRVQAVRDLMTHPGWECTVTSLFRPENMGLRVAVTDALDWFFEYEEEGIILEDDCVPTPDFFRLAEHALDTYRSNEMVWGMTGSNTAGIAMSTDASYGFAQHPLIWGWASWADRWKRRDYELSTFPPALQAGLTRNWPSKDHKHVFFRHLSGIIRTGLPNTWDYPWSWTVMKNHGLWIVPNAQLVTNIGYGDDATNTKGVGPQGPPPAPLRQIIPASTVEANRSAERQILVHIHGLKRRYWLNSVRFTIRYLCSLLRRNKALPPVLPGSTRESV